MWDGPLQLETSVCLNRPGRSGGRPLGQAVAGGSHPPPTRLALGRVGVCVGRVHYNP